LNVSEAKSAYRIVIPARLKSTRLPNKPLQDVAGKPLIVRVIEQVVQSAAPEIWVAVDDVAVYEQVAPLQAIYPSLRIAMTRNDHESGTDRLGELALQQNWHDQDVIVNVQGDEPLIPLAAIDQVAQRLMQSSGSVAMATLAHAIENEADYNNPNVVKVVCRADGQALYFSRATIPFDRDAALNQQITSLALAKRHIGIYAYRAGFLKRFSSLPMSPLEQLEKLEQLRALWHGFGIVVDDYTDHFPAGVDTQSDLERVSRFFS
jgi:3-deoxy-manno-octulosonate cytidylyltransferase (CMP-KDO synthetase)